MGKIISLVLVLCLASSLLFGCSIEQTDESVTPSETPGITSSPETSISPGESEHPVSNEPTPTTEPEITEYHSPDVSQASEEALRVIDEAFVELPYVGYGVIPHELNCEEVLTLKYSDGLTTFSVGGEAYGPACFDVYDNKIYIADSYGYKVLVFNEGQLEETISCEGLFANKIIVEDNHIKLTNENYGVITLPIETGSSITFPYGNELYPTAPSYTLTDKNTVLINDYNLKIFIEGDFKSLYMIAVFDEVSYVFIKEESKDDIRISERNVYVIKDNEVINKVRLLESPFSMVKPSQSSVVDEKGDIYQMFYDENYDVHVYKLNMALPYVSSIKYFQSTAPPISEINRYEDPSGNSILLKSYKVYSDGRYLYIPNNDNSDTLLEIPFSFESRIGFEFASGPTGPQSFFIDGNEIYIGNTYKHNILKYIDGKYDSEFEYDSSLYLLDFCIIDGTYYILARTYDHESGNPGITLNVIASSKEIIKQIGIINLTNDFDSYIPPSKLYVFGNNLIIKFENTGEFFILDLNSEDIWIKYIDNHIAINTAREDEFSVRTNDGTLVLPVYGEIKNPNCYWIDEGTYFITNEYRYEDETTGAVVTEKVLTIVEGNAVTARMLLFDKNPMITLNRQVFVSQDNQVYQMLFDDEYNLSILKLNTEEQYVSYWFK